MSFREVRSFTETMKCLGYPRLISMENFRTPNFELVADCLHWLVNRYHPGADISDEISTEHDRVNFLQSVAQIMLTKARMKLNIKRLYAADLAAVRELLKVASLLHKATVAASNESEDVDEHADFSALLKGFNAKEIRQYAAEIIRSGASLYDVLANEGDLRETRLRAVAGQLDTEFVEKSIREAIEQVEDHVRSLEEQLQELARTEKSVEAKIEKRKLELERNEKRLSTLQSVRPAYMDEYERLQGELNDMYGQYLDKFRNLEFLEYELEQYYRAEQEKAEATERRLTKMRNKLADEVMRVLKGEAEVDESGINTNLDDDDDSLLSEDDEDDRPQQSRAPVTRHANERVQRLENGRQVVGSLLAVEEDDSVDGSEEDDADGDQVSMGDSEERGIANRGYMGEEDGTFIDEDEEGSEDSGTF